MNTKKVKMGKKMILMKDGDNDPGWISACIRMKAEKR